MAGGVWYTGISIINIMLRVGALNFGLKLSLAVRVSTATPVRNYFITYLFRFDFVLERFRETRRYKVV